MALLFKQYRADDIIKIIAIKQQIGNQARFVFLQIKVENSAVGAEIKTDPIAWLNENSLQRMDLGIACLSIAAAGMLIKGSEAAIAIYANGLNMKSAKLNININEHIIAKLDPKIVI